MQRLARQLVADPDLADDVAQETLTAALERAPSDRAALPAWLGVIARHRASNARRAAARRARHERAAAKPEGDAAATDVFDRLEVQQTLLAQVRALREPYRTAIWLRYFDDLPPRAIARRLGLPVKTVKTHLYRGLDALRHSLDRRCGGDRSRWVAALIPLHQNALAAVSIPGGALLVKKTLIVAAAAAIALTGWLTLGGGEPQTIPASPGTVTPAQGAARTRDATSEAIASAAPHRSAAVPTAARTGSLRVRLRWTGTQGPAADVGVTAYGSADHGSRRARRATRTDARGVAVFAAMPAGDLTLWLDRGHRFGGLEVVAGEDREIELEVPAGTTIAGRATAPDGSPVPGAEIWAHRHHPGFYASGVIARTAADGSFTVEGVEARTEIGAWAPGFTPSVLVEPSALPEDARGRRQVDLRLGETGGRVAGRVLDADRRPVAGAVVKIGSRGGHIVDLDDGLRATATRPMLLTTDAAGAFATSGDLPLGSHPVAAMAPESPIWSGDIIVRANATADLEIVLRRPVRITGRVLDLEGAPVADAKVVAAVEVGGGWYFETFPPATAKSDTTGHYVLELVAPGDIELNASVARKPSLGKAQTRLQATDGASITLDLVLDPGATIDGTVFDREGDPLGGWRVHTANDGRVYPRQAETAADGTFRLANLEPDHAYIVRVSAPGDPPVPARAERRGVRPSATALQFVIEDASVPDAGVRGQLVGSEGRPPANVQLTYYPEGSNMGGFLTVDPEDGTFEKTSLRPGTYRLRALRGGQMVYESPPLELSSGEVTDAGTLRLATGGRVELSVTGIDDAQRSALSLRMDRPGHGTETLDLRDAVFVSRELLPGTWSLRAGGERWCVSPAEIEVPAGRTASISVTAHAAREVRVECTLPGAGWRTLHYEVRDDEQTLFRRGTHRESAQAEPEHAQVLYGLALPDGTFTLRAWTDAGLQGELRLTVGGTAPPRHRLVLR